MAPAQPDNSISVLGMEFGEGLDFFLRKQHRLLELPFILCNRLLLFAHMFTDLIYLISLNNGIFLFP